jgi:hypothetical protein
MDMNLTQEILDQIGSYEINFSSSLGHNDIQCVDKNTGAHTTSTIPDDHFTESAIIDIIRFNIERLKE